ncbi:MAG: ribosome biogenesis factor YjgA [Gammaproteobacteria bacterium]
MASDITDSPDDDFIDPYDGPSKSQLKREALAVRDLGVELVKLTSVQLEKIPLPDNIRAAVEQAQRIKAHGGRRRQLQYIGKLLRQLDTNPCPLTDLQSGAVIARRELHWLERRPVMP